MWLSLAESSLFQYSVCKVEFQLYSIIYVIIKESHYLIALSVTLRKKLIPFARYLKIVVSITETNYYSFAEISFFGR